MMSRVLGTNFLFALEMGWKFAVPSFMATLRHPQILSTRTELEVHRITEDRPQPGGPHKEGPADLSKYFMGVHRWTKE